MSSELPLRIRKKRGWRPRTVLVTLALLMLGEYVFLSWVRQYGNNKDLVSQVSFGGTLVGIVLAILAIVYAYYQTFSQQRDSATLGTQISSLADVVRNTRLSSADLAVDLSRLSEISDKLDESIEIAQQHGKQVKGLTDSFEALKASAVKPDTLPRVSSHQQELSEIAALDRVLGPTLTMFEATIYKALTVASSLNLSASDAVTVVADAAKDDGMDPVGAAWAEGVAFGTWLMLLNLKIIKDARGTEYIGTFSPAFITKLDERIDGGSLPSGQQTSKLSLASVLKVAQRTANQKRRPHATPATE